MMEQPSTSNINAGASAAATSDLPPAGNMSTQNSNGEQSLRFCSNANCNVNKVVEVTNRKCSQFVSSPYIMPKPLFVNDKTAVFQIGGDMAKMGDIPTVPGSNGEGQPIYRIKPGTHAHIINYVLVDDEKEAMDMAKSVEQDYKRKMLDAQRQSATSKLQKLIASHRAVSASYTAAATQAAGPNVATAANQLPVPTLPAAAGTHVTTPQIHPDFSIASVEGAVAFAAQPAAVVAATTRAPASLSEPVSSEDACSQLQAEILELRRTIANLEKDTHPPQ